jgi:RHS repeat-associated protein
LPASLGATAFTYGASGNLQSDYARTYTWDGESRLIGIAGTASGTPYTTEISYDGLGRRTAMATATGGTTGMLHYGWCCQTLCQERSANDTPLRRYFAEGEFDAAQGALIYGVDHLGSVHDVIAASGRKANHFDYDPYGRATAATGSRATWPDFRYAGLFYHQPSGLYLATNRAYDPAIGRWLSRDPIAEQGGVNLYAYVGGNPIGAIDPSGLAVYVGEHGAIFPGDPINHAAIVLQPDNPSDFQNSPLFQSNGGQQATLGAQAFGPNVLGLFGGLVSKSNYHGDSPCNLKNLTLVPTPAGMSDTDFINSLIAAAGRYGNDQMYDPFPDPFGLTYNSNGFVSGVINAAGGTPPGLPGLTPGYNESVPISSTK